MSKLMKEEIRELFDSVFTDNESTSDEDYGNELDSYTAGMENYTTLETVVLKSEFNEPAFSSTSTVVNPSPTFKSSKLLLS